jgi:hypothetical protein
VRSSSNKTEGKTHVKTFRVLMIVIYLTFIITLYYCLDMHFMQSQYSASFTARESTAKLNRRERLSLPRHPVKHAFAQGSGLRNVTLCGVSVRCNFSRVFHRTVLKQSNCLFNIILKTEMSLDHCFISYLMSCSNIIIVLCIKRTPISSIV